MRVNRFNKTISSVALGTQPAAAHGTAVTPGNLAYGAYAQMLTATSDDSCEVEIGINTVGIAAVARDTLITVGWDPGGGSSFGVSNRTTINHLIGACASSYLGGAGGLGHGVTYHLPLRIPAGSTVAAQAMVNSANVTDIRVFCRLRCRPSRPDLIYVGTFVDTYGINLGTAAGTAITAGTAARGTYVSLGALTNTYNYFEIGMGINNAGMGNLGYEVDLAIGDVTNKDIIIESAGFATTNAEVVVKHGGAGRYASVSSGTLFGRAQANAAPNTGLSLAAYAVGG